MYGKVEGYRLPEEYNEWALTIVGMAKVGELLFPAEVVFSLVNDQFYVNIL